MTGRESDKNGEAMAMSAEVEAFLRRWCYWRDAYGEEFRRAVKALIANAKAEEREEHRIAWENDVNELAAAREVANGLRRELAEANQLLRRIVQANVIFPSMCANNTEAMELNIKLARYK